MNRGIAAGHCRDRWDQSRAALESMFVSGAVRYGEIIAEDIDGAPQAFIGVLGERDIGKRLVALDRQPT